MAATATSVRYAPEDPTLPKPWRGLVDGKTGYLYFWNPETNVTQYERPASRLDKSSSVALSTSVQGKCHNSDDRDKGSHKLASEAGSYQDAEAGYGQSHDKAEHAKGSSDGSSGAKFQSPSAVGSGLTGEAYRRQHEITVTGINVPQPFTLFEATGFPPEILREVKNAGFSAPTPIQAQSWPIALQGQDIVAVAKTGSGKTLGYLIPGFLHLKRRNNNPKMGPTVLVLSPTRELATQIQDEAAKFGKSSRIACTCLYGGAPKIPQLKELDRGADIVVATPGRLNDILEMRRVSLHQVSYLVLDEADRMLDMGFEPQIRKIVNEVPSQRQTLMFTATWPKEVRKIANDLLVKPVQVNIGNVDELVANKSITQHVEVLPPMEKRKRLEQILRSEEPGSKIIVFCSTKKMCDLLARNLNNQFGAAAIHGDKSQAERDHVLNQFRTGRSPVLVATDVAARGLDIKDIRVVINYDFPTGIEDYIHRIGRTGRAGATGVAYSFFGDQDSKYASDLIKILEGADQSVPVELRNMTSYGGGMGRSRYHADSAFGGRDGGRGGRYNSEYSGRDDGRGGGRSLSSLDRGGGRGYDNGSSDSSRYSRSLHDAGDAEATESNQRKSFHELMMQSSMKCDQSRSRSRSPTKGSGWSEYKSPVRSRSPSIERSDLAQGRPLSFHESMMARAAASKMQQPSPDSAGDNPKSFDDPRSQLEKSQGSDSGAPLGDNGHSFDDGRQDCSQKEKESTDGIGVEDAMNDGTVTE